MKELNLNCKLTKSGKRMYTITDDKGRVITSSSSVSRDYVAIMGVFDDSGEAHVTNRFGRLDLIGKGDSARYYGKSNSWIAHTAENRTRSSRNAQLADLAQEIRKTEEEKTIDRLDLRERVGNLDKLISVEDIADWNKLCTDGAPFQDRETFVKYLENKYGVADPYKDGFGWTFDPETPVKETPVKEKIAVADPYKEKIAEPTTAQCGTFQKLYAYLNAELFGGKLNDCLLTMVPNRAQSGGHFWPEKWHKEDKPVHEISMNPKGYAVNDAERFVSILVHEMCHLWAFDNLEKPPRAGYHCKKWGAKMKEIGLYPSDTGEPGGKETGQKMTHYIEDHGLFKEVFERMDKDLLLPFKRYQDPEKPKAKKTKVKYICPGCDSKVWGKPGLKIACFDEICEHKGEVLVSDEPEGEEE